MTKDELKAKRAVALSELKNIEVALCLDEHYIDILEKENAELKADNDARKFAMTMSEKVEKQLRKENAELKEQNRNYEQLIDNGSVTLAKERLKNYKQLTKAKKLLAKWVELYKPKLEGYPITPIQEQTEQFLKEIEK